jgi:hypothetical protein
MVNKIEVTNNIEVTNKTESEKTKTEKIKGRDEKTGRRMR